MRKVYVKQTGPYKYSIIDLETHQELECFGYLSTAILHALKHYDLVDEVAVL